jgi:hypothetical protein
MFKELEDIYRRILEASFGVLKSLRHTGESRCPQPKYWIPAYAGMTRFISKLRGNEPPNIEEHFF